MKKWIKNNAPRQTCQEFFNTETAEVMLFADKLNDDMRALTIKPFWAWLIANAFKDVENRSWNTKFIKRPFFIHTSKTWEISEYQDCLAFAFSVDKAIAEAMPTVDEMRAQWSGVICAIAEIEKVFPPLPNQLTSPWHFETSYGFKLANIKKLQKFIPLRGSLGFFKVDGEIQKIAKAQILL